MKVKCLHGFFIFEDTAQGQISDFMSYTGLEIEKKGNYFTFSDLINAPDFSIKNKSYLNETAIKTFEGNPWDVFEQNEFIYDFTSGLIKPITSIVNTVTINHSGNKFVTNGLILPGSLTAEGERVKDFSAWYSRQTLRWIYDEVVYV